MIVVSDGSTDDTVGIEFRIRGTGVRVIHYEHHEGKERASCRVARGPRATVAFLDADGDIKPEAIRPFSR